MDRRWNRHRSVFRAAVSALALAIAAASCGPPLPPGEQELFDEGNVSFESGRYTGAINAYDELLEQHPFSDLAEIARLRVAHAYYLSRSYEKAVAAFNDFERLHPTSPLLPFVEYTIGMSYLRQARAHDRDKTASENALGQFERLRERYGYSLYGRLAEFRVGQCNENLASHELYIGDFYVKMQKRDAGLTRYRSVIERYPQTDAAEEARKRLRAHEAHVEMDAAETVDGAQESMLPRSPDTVAASTPIADK